MAGFTPEVRRAMTRGRHWMLRPWLDRYAAFGTELWGPIAPAAAAAPLNDDDVPDLVENFELHDQWGPPPRPKATASMALLAIRNEK